MRDEPAVSLQRAFGGEVLQLQASRLSAGAGACLRALERLELAVDGETDALARHARADLADFNQRKSVGLLELSRAVRGLHPAELTTQIAPRLASLREKLARNSTVLKMHLDAVSEVAGIVSGALREAESDGTYSAARRFAGGAA